MQNSLSARLARIDDARPLWDWRFDEQVARWTRTPDADVSFESHLAWLTNVIADPGRVLVVFERDGSPVATVRFDCLDSADGQAELSVIVDPARHGEGIGTEALAGAMQKWVPEGVRTVIANIRPANAASISLFRAGGFSFVGEQGGWCEYRAHTRGEGTTNLSRSD